jgi:DNA replication initiation complex subunit (GINS family)
LEQRRNELGARVDDQAIAVAREHRERAGEVQQAAPGFEGRDGCHFLVRREDRAEGNAERRDRETEHREQVDEHRRALALGRDVERAEQSGRRCGGDRQEAGREPREDRERIREDLPELIAISAADRVCEVAL